MRRLKGRARGPGSVAAAATLLLAGCNPTQVASPTYGPPTSTPALLTSAQADTVAEVVSAEASSLADGSTLSGDSTFYASLGSPRPPAVNLVVVGLPSCAPVRSPLPLVDSDSDGVADSLRVDFTGCTLSFPLVTVTYGGTVDIVDPTPSASDSLLKLVFTGFSRSETDLATGKTRSAVRTGTRSRAGGADTLRFSETGFQTTYTFRDSSTATHVRTWTSIFHADSPGTIRLDSLPSGLWGVTGRSAWSRGSNIDSVVVNTGPPLHFNATCASAPRFDAGTLKAVVTKGGARSTVTITFTGCGQYTATNS